MAGKKTLNQSVSRRTAKSGDQTAGHEVVISFHAPEARRVCLAGDFNRWDTESIRLRRYRDGTWKRKIRLQPGRYEYRLFVDGDWVQNVPGTETVPNSFGTLNCVIRVE